MSSKKKSKKEYSGGLFTPLITLGTELKKQRETEKKEERKFLSKRLKTKDKREIRQIEYQRELRKKEEGKERTTKRLKSYKETAERISQAPERIISGLTKKKLLKTPKAKVPAYSATRFVKQLAVSTEPLVREVPPKEIVRDDRSLYFNGEFTGEKKWLLK